MDDEKIIELFFSRSEQAINELSSKYGAILHKLSYNILNDKQDAEECVNDAYLGAWNSIPPARPNPLLTYVCKIVRNLSLKKYHKKQALKRNSTFDVALQEIEAYLPSYNNVEHEIETKELVRIIEQFLDKLTPENRIIFMRRYWFSDSYADIAAKLGITEKNVSVRLTRIRRQLKKYLIESEEYL